MMKNNEYLIIALIVAISSVGFSGQILIYPKSIDVVRGSNVSFSVFVSNTDNTQLKYSSWIVGEKYSCYPEYKALKNNEVGEFSLTYFSRDIQIGKKAIYVSATKSSPVKIDVTILPNERDKKIINDTFWFYVDRMDKIRKYISNDRNASSNGMFSLTNIVIEKLWNIDGDIKNGKYYDAYRKLNDVKPQIEALEDYTKSPSGYEKISARKILIILAMALSFVMIVIIIFELAKHFLNF